MGGGVGAGESGKKANFEITCHGIVCSSRQVFNIKEILIFGMYDEPHE